jgi:hypothetical protein
VKRNKNIMHISNVTSLKISILLNNPLFIGFLSMRNIKRSNDGIIQQNIYRDGISFIKTIAIAKTNLLVMNNGHIRTALSILVFIFK